jgi:hypothetical protein
MPSFNGGIFINYAVWNPMCVKPAVPHNYYRASGPEGILPAKKFKQKNTPQVQGIFIMLRRLIKGCLF